MPIKINELTIKAKIVEEDSKPDNESASVTQLDPDMIIRECVDQVMEIINNKMER